MVSIWISAPIFILLRLLESGFQRFPDSFWRSLSLGVSSIMSSVLLLRLDGWIVGVSPTGMSAFGVSSNLTRLLLSGAAGAELLDCWIVGVSATGMSASGGSSNRTRLLLSGAAAEELGICWTV